MEPKTARDKFNVGQRVKMTADALRRGLDGPRAKRSTGIVRSFPNRAPAMDPALLVTVLRDGEKQSKTYHMDFWEPDLLTTEKENPNV